MPPSETQQVTFTLAAVRCFQCQRPMPPDEPFARRQAKTAVEVNRHREQVDRYEMVTLCLDCDTAVAQEQEKESNRQFRKWRYFGWTIGGLIVTQSVHALGAPLGLAMLSAFALAWFQIMGRTIMLMMAIAFITQLFGSRVADTHGGLLLMATVASLLCYTYGRKFYAQETKQPARLHSTNQDAPVQTVAHAAN